MTKDSSKLAFDSDFRYERVVRRGSIGFSVSGAFASKTVTVTHSLGYKPYIRAWYTYGDGKYFALFAGVRSYDIDGNGFQIDNSNITSSTFTITIAEENGAAATASGTIYYRIYGEPQA